jgi:ribosomal protein S18 acetylase RimI-like enzyme
MSKRARLIREDELEQLLTLYQYLNPDDPALDVEGIEKLWKEILSNHNYFYLIVEVDGFLVSTCNLTIVQNLTRKARPYGLIENVVTHPEHREKGYGTLVLRKAVEIARENNCYKVMLLTSQKDEPTLNFYEKAGFSRGEKTGFIVRM